MALFLKIHPENPLFKNIKTAVEIMQNGGIAIYPTDSVYGMGVLLSNKKGIEKLIWYKKRYTSQIYFSLIFANLEQLSEYVLPLDKSQFRILKKNLPGPFTFILKPQKKLEKILGIKNHSIGVRIPNNKIIRMMVEYAGEPVVNMSVKVFEDPIEYTIDPELIYEKYKNEVDVIINGGFGKLEPSTVVDITGEEPEIIRQGSGNLVL